MTQTSVRPPDLVEVQVRPGESWTSPSRTGVTVELVPEGQGLRVDIGTVSEVARVRLRWWATTLPDALVLGDAWERSYGDLAWLPVHEDRILPWTALVHEPSEGRTRGYGVEVRGGAFAHWRVLSDAVVLVLDVCSGGEAVRPGDRRIHAATIRWNEETTRGAFAAQCELAALQCTDPLLPAHPVAGANNWYYAYGQGLTVETFARDARLVSELAGNSAVRPFAVLDDGWSPDGVADGHGASGGPWTEGRTATFPAMAEAASAVRAEGARPGIWFRPLLTRENEPAGARWPRDGRIAVDPSSPDVLERVAADIARLAGWGYEMIKHDFSTVDLVGRWGFEMGDRPSRGPALHRGDLTTAEALVGLYTTIGDAAGEALVIGCNTVGHLSAGLHHISRTGDDVSGRDWDRTRRMGVNTLAFRLAQHDRFFAVDADCVPCTTDVAWDLHREFLDLVSRSRTALFVSIDPAARTDRSDDDIARALRRTLGGPTTSDLEPMDWLGTTTPGTWHDDSTGETLHYDWDTAAGSTRS